MVRRNAALALANFQDAAARPELLAMLRPYTLRAQAAGVLRYRLKGDEYVNPGTLVAHIGSAEVRAPVPGDIRALSQREGAAVRPGDALAEIAPDKEHAWEALRALWVVGAKEDLEDVRRYVRGVPGMPERLQRQALLTAQAIEQRRQ
jgi:multidrug efflux pump subunit AcrA (membrane-fusion protein)